jgi:type IV pilus assembly protein PilW
VKRGIPVGAQRVGGFSLVELMVAGTLGLIVMAAVLASFAGSRAASNSTTGTSALTDTGRYTLATLAESVRTAGYLACTSSALYAPLTLLNQAVIPIPVAYNFVDPLQGFEASSTGPGQAVAVVAAPTADGNAGDWAGGLDGGLVGLPVKGSDVLAVHGTLQDTTPAYVTAIATGADSFTVAAIPANWPTPTTGLTVAVSDCTTAITFVITGVGGTTVFHDIGGSGPGNVTAAWSPQLAAGSQVQPISTTVYYLGVGEDGDSALFAAVWNAAANSYTTTEIAPDVENMQVLYGIDTVGAGTVTQYVTANQVAVWTQVLNVQVAILAASPLNAVTPPTAAQTFNLLGTLVTVPIDSRRRQVFTTTITLRNTVS